MQRTQMIIVMAGAIGLLVFGEVRSTLAQSGRGAGDIYCNCNKRRFLVPMACPRSCRRRLGCGGCFLSPQCAALKGNRRLKQLYNQALFGRGPLGASVAARRVLVAYIVNRYYKPYHAGLLDISIVGQKGHSWAKILNRKNAAGKWSLSVDPDLFLLTPAKLVTGIGHEMVHLSQYRRKYPGIDLTGIDPVITAFRELEASLWETGTTAFKSKIGSNKYWSCLDPKGEQQETRIAVKCYRWAVERAIERVMSPTNLRAKYKKDLEKWLNADPFTKRYWLPKNPRWKTHKAGPKPPQC